MTEQANNDAAAQPRGRHTPGPWEAEKAGVYAVDRCVAMRHPGEGNHARWAANARLIAAAPETAAERDALRELCGELVDALVRTVAWAELAKTHPMAKVAPGCAEKVCEIARAALARAREMGVGK